LDIFLEYEPDFGDVLAGDFYSRRFPFKITLIYVEAEYMLLFRPFISLFQRYEVFLAV